jgi:hypothetical protein
MSHSSQTAQEEPDIHKDWREQCDHDVAVSESPTAVLTDEEVHNLLKLGLEAGCNGSPTVREVPRLADVWKSQTMPNAICVQFINGDDCVAFLRTMRNVLLIQRESN